jgi:hypothetical protein
MRGSNLPYGTCRDSKAARAMPRRRSNSAAYLGTLCGDDSLPILQHTETYRTPGDLLKGD